MQLNEILLLLLPMFSGFFISSKCNIGEKAGNYKI